MTGNVENVGNNVYIRREQLSLAPLHACNALFECFLLFLCHGSDPARFGESVCVDSFLVGGGAITSVITLLSGESDSSIISLQAMGWHHFTSICAQFHRALLEGTLFSVGWINVVTVAHMILFVLPLAEVVERKAMRMDTFVGILCCAAFLSTVGTGLEGNLLRSLIKAIPVFIMAFRLYQLHWPDNFTARVTLAMILCGIADFALEHSFLGGLGTFLVGHVMFIYGFVADNDNLAINRAIPILGYSVMVFIVLAPHLGNMFLPVAVYFIAVATMLWRAAVLDLDKAWGKQIAFGALAFALSDTLIGVDKFVNPIANARFPILGLYWLGQALITSGTLERLNKQEASAPLKSDKDQ